MLRQYVTGNPNCRKGRLRRVYCSIHLMWPTFCIDVGASRCIPARETQRRNGDAKPFSEVRVLL